jgi:hypothetical protein
MFPPCPQRPQVVFLKNYDTLDVKKWQNVRVIKKRACWRRDQLKNNGTISTQLVLCATCNYIMPGSLKLNCRNQEDNKDKAPFTLLISLFITYFYKAIARLACTYTK